MEREADYECPQCALKNREILELRKTQEICADKHDLFLNKVIIIITIIVTVIIIIFLNVIIFFLQLMEAEDGFSVIAEYFSNNTMFYLNIVLQSLI